MEPKDTLLLNLPFNKNGGRGTKLAYKFMVFTPLQAIELSLRLNKTKYVILLKLKMDEPFFVKINGFEIVQTRSYKYLGIIIDDKR